MGSTCKYVEENLKERAFFHPLVFCLQEGQAVGAGGEGDRHLLSSCLVQMLSYQPLIKSRVYLLSRR